ncbi:MAG: type VI secretion system baseplate subunit TssF [Longimicrobiales bacterium]
MRDDLLHYYERELSFIRKTGTEFARRYPKVAARLQLEPTKSDDPHVERLIEGFALLAARVHLKIDDEAPEISEALLGMLYPQHVNPVPSLSLVELTLDPDQGELASGLQVPRGTNLFSRPVAGAECRFRTCYDTTVWPVEVEAAKWCATHELRPSIRAPNAPSALRLSLRCTTDLAFSDLQLETLRLHLRGESAMTSTLYELLDNNCVGILLRDPEQPAVEPLTLSQESLRPVGFEPDELLLPSVRPAFVGYGLIQEYFAFPDKYLFFDLTGLEAIRARGFGPSMEVVFLISPFERDDRRAALNHGVAAESIRLGCTPIVNLFDRTSEPILLDQRKPEYLVIPDARRRDTTGVYSVNAVLGSSPGLPEPIQYEPFNSFRHATPPGGSNTFWHARRRARNWRLDEGTDVFLTFLDTSSRTAYPDEDVVTARLTCHNADLPSRLPFGEAGTDLEMPGGGPLQKISVLTQPTAPIEPALGKPQLWRLISQLSLNYLSLTEGGADGLQELLRLHNTANASSAEAQIQGITDVQGSPCHSPIQTEQGLAFARGSRVEVDFDEERFTGSGVYLFAAVLERFFGLYTSMNSFTSLVARSKQRKRVIREWPPRSGGKPLL